MKTTVLIADDHTILREGLRALIEKHKTYRVVGEAADGRETLDLAHRLRPEIIIMDITMPDMNGIEATTRILSQHPETKVIGLSMHADRQYVTRMLHAGASGYLLKHCASEEVIEALQTILRGQIYLSPALSGVYVQDFSKPDDRRTREARFTLTPKEREVLQLLAEGHSNKQIAGHLHVSEKTIEKHRFNIMEKLNLYSVAELTKYAIREGITPVER